MSGTDTQMDIGGHTFEFICDIEPLRDPHGAIQQFMPQSRYAKASAVPINRYGAGPFCKFKIPRSHRVPGVYALTIADALRYIGECADFSARFNNGYGNISPKNCYKGGQETNCRLNNLVYMAAASGEAIRLWFLPTDDYKAVEARLRDVLKPIWNRV
ncbi:MAG TPA: GIY-YIG nuclease family protein [Rhizomicrobium sp.]